MTDLRCPTIGCPWVYRAGQDDPAVVTQHLAEHRAATPTTVADRIRAEQVPCPDHPMPFPKPSCWTCGRNGAFERAARIADRHAEQIGPSRAGS